MILVQAAMLLPPSPHAWILWLLLALCAPATTLTQAQVGLAFPAGLAGRANAAYNMLVFAGAFAIQWGMGVLLDVLGEHGLAPALAFRATLALMVLAQTAALAYFVVQRASPQLHHD